MRYLLSTLIAFLPLLIFGQGDAYLGVYTNHVSKKKARILGFSESRGRYITRVVPGTPADRAGLRPFDYLYGMDGEVFSEDRNFHDRMEEYQAGQQVTLQFQRGLSSWNGASGWETNPCRKSDQFPRSGILSWAFSPNTVSNVQMGFRFRLSSALPPRGWGCKMVI